MANYRGKQIANIQRLILPEITPIEIWDCKVPNGILWDFMYSDSFPNVLKATLEKIHDGTAVTASGQIIPRLSQAFDSLYVCGGGAQNNAVVEALRKLSVPTVVAKDPLFSSTVEGHRLLAQMNLEGPVVDIGQTQIKISNNGIKSVFKRDFDTLLVRTGHNDYLRNEQLTFFYEYVSASIKKCIDGSCPPEAMVLALPCAISPSGNLGESSYIGMNANTKMISEIACQSGLENKIILLLNDAELAAHGALFDQRLADFRRTLVITLGFGVGASVIEPPEFNS